MTLTDKFNHETTSLRRRSAARRLVVMPKLVRPPSSPWLDDALFQEEPTSHAMPAETLDIVATDPPCTSGGPPDLGAIWAFLLAAFATLHRRLDTIDRHAADLMFLQLSSQELLIGKRRPFSRGSRDLITRVVANEPYKGLCPCCAAEPVLSGRAQPAPGAEFDHYYHCSLNRPEFGWLICTACHHELTHDGYLARFRRMAAFRRFQAAVIRHRRRAQMRLDPDDHC